MKHALPVLILLPMLVLAQNPTPSLTTERMNNYRNPLERPPAGTGTRGPVQPPATTGNALDARPAPSAGRIYTIKDLEANKFTLNGQTVRVKLLKPYFTPEQVAPDMYRVFIEEKDLSASAYIYFPAEGAQKLNLLTKTARGALSFWVHVTPDRYTAIGRAGVGSW